MHLIRSFLFAIILAIVTIPYALFGILIFWAPPMTRHRLITTWVPIMMWVIRHVLGIRYRVIGRENLPATASVVLSKHQSAWETIALQQILPPLCYVLKRELLRDPSSAGAWRAFRASRSTARRARTRCRRWWSRAARA